MFKSIAVIILALGLTQATPSIKLGNNVQVYDPRSMARADASAWVDEIMANVRSLILEAGLDRVTLPPFEVGFSKTILGITWHGEASLTEGFLTGFETLHRTGVADLSIEPNGDIVVSVEAGVNEGSLGYAMSVKFMDLGPKAVATGSIKNIRVLLTIRLSTELKATVEKLDIKNLGILSVDVKGLGFVLNFLIEIVVNAIGNVVKGVVGDLLQGVIKSLINNVLDNMPPLLGSRLATYAAIQHAVPQYAVPYIR